MKNLIAKMNDFKNNIFIEFKTDKLKFILKYLILIISFVCLATLPSFTYREQFNDITNILCIVLAIFAFLYVIFKGRIVINYYILCMVLFMLFSVILTAFTTHTWETVRSILTLYSISCVFFTCIINLKKPNFYIISLLIGFIVLSIWFVIDNKDYFLTFNFTDRIGDTFGNLNTVGGMFALASTILFYYIFKHKKWYFLLLVVEVLFAILTAVTGSKSALVLFVLGFLINLYFLFGKKKIIWYVITVIGFIALFIVILLLPPFEVIKDRFIDMFLTLFSGASYDLSTAQRYNMFIDGIYLWLKNIFFGNGSQAFSILTSYGTYSHSTVSELLCNFGLVGFILFYLSFFKMITRKNKSRFYPLILSFSISFLLFGSIISVIYISKHIIIFGSLLAAISFLDNDESDRAICINFDILHKKINLQFNNFKSIGNKKFKSNSSMDNVPTNKEADY